MMNTTFNLLPMTTFRWTKSNATEMDVLPPKEAVGARAVWSGDIERVAAAQDKQAEAIWQEQRRQFRGASPETLAAALGSESERFSVQVAAGETADLRVDVTLRRDALNWLGLIVVQLEPQAQLHLTIALSAEEEGGQINYGLIADLAEDARLTVTKVHTGKECMTTIEHRYTALAERAEAEYLAAEFGARRVVYHGDADLRGDEAAISEECIYIGTRDEHIDLYYDRNQYGKRSRSHLATYGALRDSSKKVFRGCIDFKRGASGSVGNEEDYVILLSDRVKNVSLPLLLCTEDDVQGNHASSSGQIDKERMFYLMTRGFSKEDAKRMVVEAMLRPAIDRIAADDLRANVLHAVAQKMDVTDK